MCANPLISVVIPVYNTEKYLADAIESVLGQTYQKFELILVDDGSTDGSAAVAQRYIPRITVLSHANAGSSVARNTGLKEAHGEYYSFLDADDIWTKNKLTLQLMAFQSNPMLDAVFGHIEQFFSPELSEEFRKRIYCPPEWVPGYCSSTMLVKSQAFWKVGCFDPRLSIGEDMDWYLRAQEVGLQMTMLPEMVYRRRLHENNKGMRLKEEQIQRVRIIKAALDRRRSTSAASKEETTPPDFSPAGSGHHSIQ
jgi:glycosyltransferase involved in cell wall biosynthesis